MNRLVTYGLRPDVQVAFDELGRKKLDLGRIAAEHKGGYQVVSAEHELLATVAGKLRHAVESGTGERPVVGDWVAIEPPASGGGVTLIHALLPRRSTIVRRAAGRTPEPQVIAANVDAVFLVTALTRDFNPRRLERYLSVAWESGAKPVVVLTKADLCEDVPALVARAHEVAPGVDVHPVSAVTGQGLDALASYFADHATVALIGSSGVGKSTLINAWLGREAMPTRPVRDDDRGRHTTTHRSLIALPSGGIVMDTPGMRELGLWEADAGLSDAFADIAEVAAECRFSNCAHEGEPGCAIDAALADGRLDAERLKSFKALQREEQRLTDRSDPVARTRSKAHNKAMSRALRAAIRGKRK
jgi:ribosome biogenesis GTPase / thiamine phosphate phosphatase